MNSSRWIRASAALCLVGALSSCSGDDDKDKNGDAGPSANSTESSGDPTSPTDPGSDGPQGDISAKCTAEVQVTGAVELSWQGPGQVRKTTTPESDGPRAVYVSAYQGARVSLYSTGKNFATSANFSTKEAAFTTPLGDDAGLDEIDTLGRAATVDVDMVGLQEPGVHVTATFEC